MALKTDLYSSPAGFSFIELLIAMATGLVVLGAAYQSFQVQQRVYAAQEQVTEMHQQARAALDFMVQELRMAHTITQHDATPGDSSITCIIFDPALNEDQTRGFSRNDSNTLIYIRGDAFQPLAENISSLTITSNGPLLTISLTARSSTKDPNLGDYRTVTLMSRVRPRNI